MQASPSVRSLVEALEQSDLIVLISVEPPGAWNLVDGRRYHGSTRLLATAGGQRYVGIWLDSLWYPGRLNRRRIALLAHELQHANEVAAAPNVVDEASLVSLYWRIGRELWPRHFETDAAQYVEGRVAAELAAALGKPDTR